MVKEIIYNHDVDNINVTYPAAAAVAIHEIMTIQFDVLPCVDRGN